MPVWLSMFLSRNGPALTAVAGSAVIILGVYMKGRADCADKHRRQAAKIEAMWAEKVAASSVEAYAKGLSDAKLEAQNQEKVDEIGKQAAQEPGAGDVCLSSDVVERLRDLQ